jgi:uncharacterized protein (TIGR03083 family)
MDVWAAIRGERLALVDDLEGLKPDQWDVQSLCGEWRVRDVVAHLAWAAGGVSVGSFAAGMLRHGLNFNTWNAAAARLGGQRPPDQLLADYRAVVDEQRTIPGAKPPDMMCDTIIHGQDVRRPLGLHRQFPGEVMLAALDHLKANTFPFGTKKRVAGLKLVATDLDWTHGEGPDVRGAGEALLLAMTGRTASFRDLFGLGREQFEARFGSS